MDNTGSGSASLPRFATDFIPLQPLNRPKTEDSHLITRLPGESVMKFRYIHSLPKVLIPWTFPLTVSIQLLPQVQRYIRLVGRVHRVCIMRLSSSSSDFLSHKGMMSSKNTYTSSRNAS